MTFKIDPLPYEFDALAPAISERTLRIHYEKHHRGYADKLAKMCETEDQRYKSLEHMIQNTEGDLYNNAAQVWNHSFYWRSMHPDGGGRPEGMLLDILGNAFGSFDDFRREFAEAANTEFGSGWAWLVADKYGRLRIQKSSDAENPMQHGFTPLLTLDVWEHAYYLDCQNDRNEYVERFLDHLVNWAHVADRLEVPGEAEIAGWDEEGGRWSIVDGGQGD